MQRLVIGAIVMLLVIVPAHARHHREARSRVPFVGCGSDGQPGTQTPPEPRPTPLLPKAFARRLAYYQARGGPGVLAPRGWRCSELLGSSGVSLTVQPEMGPKQYRVEVGYKYGGTSGRMGVAQDIARYFPSYRHLIPRLTADLHMSPMPKGPYPHDRILERTDTFVRFTTPPETNGEASLAFGRWGPSARPVQGFVMLVKVDVDPDVAEVNVQLPGADRALANTILEQAKVSLRHGDRGWPQLQ